MVFYYNAPVCSPQVLLKPIHWKPVIVFLNQQNWKNIVDYSVSNPNPLHSFVLQPMSLLYFSHLNLFTHFVKFFFQYVYLVSLLFILLYFGFVNSIRFSRMEAVAVHTRFLWDFSWFFLHFTALPWNFSLSGQLPHILLKRIWYVNPAWYVWAALSVSEWKLIILETVHWNPPCRQP